MLAYDALIAASRDRRLVLARPVEDGVAVSYSGPMGRRQWNHYSDRDEYDRVRFTINWYETRGR